MQEWELRAPDVSPVDKVASPQPANQGPAKQKPVCQKQNTRKTTLSNCVFWEGRKRLPH